jgi:hypothetical protein
MPTFLARRDYPTGIFANQLQVGDTNGDGIPDLITLPAYLNGSVSVQLGNGDGTFRPGPTSDTGAYVAYSFAAADLNTGGKVDLAIANLNGIVVCAGNGDGTFQSGVLYPINDSVAFLVAGDFNGDGILDIAAAGNSGVWLLTGKGGGTFNTAVLAVALPGSAKMSTADFNGDGELDLAVALGGGFAVLLGNGNGTFQAPQTVNVPQGPISEVVAGKLTRDGPPGIATGENCNCVLLYFGNGVGGFTGPKQLNIPWATGWGSLALGESPALRYAAFGGTRAKRSSARNGSWLVWWCAPHPLRF